MLWSFLNQNLFDEINIFVASLIVGGAKTPTVAGGSGFTNKIDTYDPNIVMNIEPYHQEENYTFIIKVQ